jgi:uncharacterized protein (DUF2132 family)
VIAPRGPKAPGETPHSAPAARSHPNDPLHGLTLKDILTQLHARYGWHGLGEVIRVRCFTHDPSMGSSLAFLRRQPWARKEVEELFLRSLATAGARAVDAAEGAAASAETAAADATEELAPPSERGE